MNKKYFLIIMLVVVLTVSLVACNDNTHEQKAVENTESGKAILNNGNVVVRQGDYIYYVNGYIGVDAENTFGAQNLSCLMRAKVGQDGTLSEKTCMVPKNIYSGIYIIGNWIYYTTPNVDKDRNGQINKTYLDIFRTSTDRKTTQLLYTINDRSAKVYFSNDCVLVYSKNAVYKIDLNKKNLKKIQHKDNYVKILDRVATVTHLDVDNAFGSTLLAVQNMEDGVSGYRSYNTLYAIDGKGNVKEIIGQDSYLDGKETTPADKYKKDTKTTVVDYVQENDKLTLYYTSTVVNTTGQSDITLKCYQFADTGFAFNKDNEKVLKKGYTGSGVEGLSFADGAIITYSALPFVAVANNNTQKTLANSELNRAVSVKGVYDGYIYYTDSGTVNALYRFKMSYEGASDPRIEEKVCDLSLQTTVFTPEFDNGYMYYIDGKTYNDSTYYIYRVKLDKNQKAELVGIMSEADHKAMTEKEENK